MAKYTSGRQKDLKVGLSSYSENLTSLEVVGNQYVTGVVTATTFYGNFNGNSSTATYATNAGISTYATNAGVATYADNAGIATYATLAGIATYSTNAGISTYATSSGIATYATNAGVSTYATNAGVATYATNSGIATYANSSGIATYATNAGVSTYATSSGIATYATSAGISTDATKLQNARTFEITGDIVGAAVTFDGTGNVSIAATIQPNSVALGSDTTGDYVQSITGTANQISVSVTSGESSTPVISIPSNSTLPGNVTIANDLQVNNNLNVTGNITIGGTSAYIIADDFRVKDADIVLGFTTNSSNQDVSNDTTANHGGIAVASTEGSPLVNLIVAGIETLPPTYKKIMWFKANAFAGLGTDAWLFNYGVGIGSTQVPNGVRLAVGGVHVTDNTVTATTFSGTATTATNAGTATTTLHIPNLSGDITSTDTVTTLATVNSNVGTYGDAGAIPRVTVNAKGLVTGVTTVAPNDGQLSLGVSGTGLSGSATFTANQSGSSAFTVTSNATDANTSSTIVARDASGNFSAGTITATLNGNASSATYATSAGVSTSVDGGSASVTQLSVSGISTLGTVEISSGIITATSTSGVVTYYGDGRFLQGVVGFAVSLQTSTSNPVYPMFANNTGVTTAGISTTQLVFIPSSGNLGLGSTNPTSKFDVIGNVKVSGVVTATTFYGSASGLTDIPTTRGIIDLTDTTMGGLYYPTFVVDSSVGIGTTTGLSLTSTKLSFRPSSGSLYISGNVGIGTTNPTQPLHVLGNARVTGAFYDSTNSPGSASQVLVSTLTGTQWAAAPAPSAVFGTPFDTGITTTTFVSVDSGIGTAVAGLTTVQANNDIFLGPGIALSFPNTAGNRYLIQSIHVANTFDNELYLTARHDFNSSTLRVPVANRVVVPYNGALELLEQPTVANPGDILRLQAFTGIGTTAGGVDGGLDAWITYSTKTDTNFVGVGTTVTTAGTNVGGISTYQTVYTSTTYPSVIQSIRIANYNLFIDVDASIAIFSSLGIRKGHLVYNLTIPKNSIVELCQQPKRLETSETIRVSVGSTTSGGANALSVCVSSKYITS